MFCCYPTLSKFGVSLERRSARSLAKSLASENLESLGFLSEREKVARKFERARPEWSEILPSLVSTAKIRFENAVRQGAGRNKDRLLWLPCAPLQKTQQSNRLAWPAKQGSVWQTTYSFASSRCLNRCCGQSNILYLNVKARTFRKQKTTEFSRRGQVKPEFGWPCVTDAIGCGGLEQAI